MKLEFQVRSRTRRGGRGIVQTVLNSFDRLLLSLNALALLEDLLRDAIQRLGERSEYLLGEVFVQPATEGRRSLRLLRGRRLLGLLLLLRWRSLCRWFLGPVFTGRSLTSLGGHAARHPIIHGVGGAIGRS